LVQRFDDDKSNLPQLANYEKDKTLSLKQCHAEHYSGNAVAFTKLLHFTFFIKDSN
jgi:hypothetical protein